MKETKEPWIYSDGRHYDLMLDSRGQTFHNTEFFLDQARKYPGLVLELACGTGRITLPLAEEVSIIGLDLSESMLDLARKKARDKGLDIEFIQGDMTDFELNRKFNLILMVGNAFAHLETLMPETKEDEVVVVNTSGRGDKDINTIMDKMGDLLR